MVESLFSEVNGNICNSDADIIVSAANCIGVMGGGVAKAIKRAFPWCFAPYKSACDESLLVPGGLFAISIKTVPLIKYPTIIHLATKDHWKGTSRIEWVKNSLENLQSYIIEHDIESVAVPRLGCGLGGLHWDDIEPLVKSTLLNANCRIIIYNYQVIL